MADCISTELWLEYNKRTSWLTGWLFGCLYSNIFQFDRCMRCFVAVVKLFSIKKKKNVPLHSKKRMVNCGDNSDKNDDDDDGDDDSVDNNCNDDDVDDYDVMETISLFLWYLWISIQYLCNTNT